MPPAQTNSDWDVIFKVITLIIAVWGAGLSSYIFFWKAKAKLTLEAEVDPQLFITSENGVDHHQMGITIKLTVINNSPERSISLDSMGVVMENQLSKSDLVERIIHYLNLVIRTISFNKWHEMLRERKEFPVSGIKQGEHFPHKLEPGENYRVRVLSQYGELMKPISRKSKGKYLIRVYVKDATGKLHKSKEPVAASN